MDCVDGLGGTAQLHPTGSLDSLATVTSDSTAGSTLGAR